MTIHLPPRTAADRATLANWLRAPYNRWSFQHVREIVPTAVIRKGSGPVLELPETSLRLGEREVSFTSHPDDGGASGSEPLARLLGRTYTDGFLVLRRGRRVFEHYDNGMTPASTHLCMSISKSITATAVGRAIAEGALSPADLVADHVPELRGTGFEGATVRHLLDMRTGTGPMTPEQSRTDMEATLWAPMSRPGVRADLTSYFAGLGNIRPHGGPFQYRSVLTCVLAQVAEHATGTRLPELISREVWQRIGAGSDADICVDGHRNGLADVGVSCTLRDLARLGEAMRRGGGVHSAVNSAVNGASDGAGAIPRAWVTDTLVPDADQRAVFAQHGARYLPVPGGYYRNQWWVAESGPQGAIYMALGIHGQLLLVHEPAEVVVAKFSTWPQGWSTLLAQDTVSACVSLAESLA
ncbi:serine hydrolase domain-containing protein [Nonomuraea insulae]|uniref:Serine hydrolase domain-containing protein n=1 Tax=Nonomuraea insulae TaxID=1616787 RepID=A0ABW1CEW9_9ACTN